MSLTKKRLAVVGAGLAVVGLTIGGVAYATFNQTASANPTGVGSETFAPLTVSGQWLGRNVGGSYPADNKLLLPGESGDVRVTLTNPGTNTVQGKVVSITPAATSHDGCSDSVKVASYTPSPATPVVLKNGTSINVTLKRAVTLNESATEACQGQTFPTSFQIKFEATRDGVTAPAALEPN